MITELNIHDFAIIEQVDIDFSSGFSVLTGETGTGKSILVDAIGLVLGDRADKSFVRHGAEQATVTARFGVSPLCRDWLSERNLLQRDNESECLVRRVINAGGQSRAYINDHATTVALLKELGQQLIDIHGQHAHQSLLRTNAARELVDAYGGCGDLLEKVNNHYAELKTLKERWQTLSESAQQRAQRVDYLQFQVRELEPLDLAPEHIAQLEHESDQLLHQDEINHALRTSLDHLSDKESANAIDAVVTAEQALAAGETHQPQLANTKQLIMQARIHLEEAIDQLQRLADGAQIDPTRQNDIENELGQLHHLARKHGVDPNELQKTFKVLSEELHDLEHSDERLDELAQEIEVIEAKYVNAATKLTEKRTLTAQKLSQQVTQTLRDVAFAEGALTIEIQTTDDISPSGQDQLRFLVQTNPGQPFQALNKIASGGELSRIGLAIQVVTSAVKAVPTLIFDEVDAGIGGAVAEQVGARLHTIADNTQVLCVTHLPQVASQADHHYKIDKVSSGETVQTKVRLLNNQQTTNEIARLLGGVDLTDTTLAHAQEMRQRASGKLIYVVNNS